MDYEVSFISVILRVGVMKSNQTFQIVESVSWREEPENEGENKYTKWENSTDRYEYIVLNIWKTCYFTLLKLLVTLSSPRSVIKSTFSEAAAGSVL